MQRLTFHIPTLMVATLAGGCVVSGHAHVRTRAHVVAQPELVYVSPGVYVIADYHEPVFYSDNYYWRYHGGYWYRSGMTACIWPICPSIWMWPNWWTRRQRCSSSPAPIRHFGLPR